MRFYVNFILIKLGWERWPLRGEVLLSPWGSVAALHPSALGAAICLCPVVHSEFLEAGIAFFLASVRSTGPGTY